MEYISPLYEPKPGVEMALMMVEDPNSPLQQSSSQIIKAVLGGLPRAKGDRARGRIVGGRGGDNINRGGR